MAMLSPARRHRATAAMVGVLLAGFLILFPTARAEAQDAGICTHPTLAGTKADTTLTVDGEGRTYPRLTSVTKYEIPSNWPDVAALLERSDETRYQNALRCFIAEWPLVQIAEVGEYRRAPPVVKIEKGPAVDGKQEPPPRIVLTDTVTGTLTSRTAPPLLGPWEVVLDSDDLLQLRLINGDDAKEYTKDFTKDFETLRPDAFRLMTWKAQIELRGLRFHDLKPSPVSTDGERAASWESFVLDASKVPRISVNLDFPARMAIAAGSGTTHAISHISWVSVNAIFYFMLFFLLFRYRKDFRLIDSGDHENQKIRPGVLAVYGISTLGLLVAVYSAVLYWLYGKYVGVEGLFIDVPLTPGLGGPFVPGVDGRGISTEYWQLLGLFVIYIVGLIIIILAFCGRCQFEKWTSKNPDIDSSVGSGIGQSSKWIIYFISAKKWTSRWVLLCAFGSFLIYYGFAVLTFPNLLKLNSDFSPIVRSAGLAKNNIYSGGGQILLMMSLTCAVLFVAVTVLHFTFSSILTSAPSGVSNGYLLPFWWFLVSSLVLSSVQVWQWVSRWMESYNRNYLFDVPGSGRNSEQFARVIERMVAYYGDLFTALIMDLMLWTAIAAIFYTLFRLGCSTVSLRPSRGEYRLLGFLLAVAASAVTTESSYLGVTVPIVFFIVFFFVGYVLPWTLQFNFNLLEKILKLTGGDDPVKKKKCERELLETLDAPKDLRGQLIVQQMEVDALRERVRTLDDKLKTGEMTLDVHEIEREKIEKSLTKILFPPTSVTFKEFQSKELPRRVRPVDIALAVGPGKSWWENGVLAARIGAIMDAPAMLYFSYIKIKDVRDFWFGSHLGLLRLLGSMVWEFGFWVIAAFVLGCLWRTLPGRRGPIKGFALWIVFAIFFGVDLFLEQGLLHQDRVDGTSSHLLLLLSELLVVGLVLDWLSADTSRVDKRSLAALYGLRGFVPTLSTLLLVVLPLLLTAIDIYSQFGSGSSFHDISQTPIPPASGGRPSP